MAPSPTLSLRSREPKAAQAVASAAGVLTGGGSRVQARAAVFLPRGIPARPHLQGERAGGRIRLWGERAAGGGRLPWRPASCSPLPSLVGLGLARPVKMAMPRGPARHGNRPIVPCLGRRQDTRPAVARHGRHGVPCRPDILRVVPSRASPMAKYIFT